MYEQQELTVEQIAHALGVSRSTIHRALNRTGSITHRRDQGEQLS
jgi:excisionase family DNA binding protein